MLNNKIIVAATLLAAAAGAGVASASTGMLDNTKMYLGAELSVLNKKSIKVPGVDEAAFPGVIKSFEKSKLGGNFFVGARFMDYFGVEAGYGLVSKATFTAADGDKTDLKLQNIFADLMGYMPVARNVDLIGSVGVGQLKAKISGVDEAALSDQGIKLKKVSYRVGAGAQYAFDQNWAARAMVRYQKGSKTFLNSNLSVSVGGTYTF